MRGLPVMTVGYVAQQAETKGWVDGRIETEEMLHHKDLSNGIQKIEALDGKVGSDYVHPTAAGVVSDAGACTNGVTLQGKSRINLVCLNIALEAVRGLCKPLFLHAVAWIPCC